MRNKSPFTDFAGSDVFEGDTIIHPSGLRGIVSFNAEKRFWHVDYRNSPAWPAISLQGALDDGAALVMYEPKHPVRRHEIASEQTDDLAETQTQTHEASTAAIMSDVHSKMSDAELVAFLREADNFAQFSNMPGSVREAVLLAIDLLASQAVPETQQAGDLAETQTHEASTAAIVFALGAEDDSGIDFLGAWNEGRFDDCRRQWPEAPEACYAGLEAPAAVGDAKHETFKEWMADWWKHHQVSMHPPSFEEVWRAALASQAVPVTQDAQQANEPEDEEAVSKRLADHTCKRVEYPDTPGMVLYHTSIGPGGPYQLYRHEAVALYRNIGAALGYAAKGEPT